MCGFATYLACFELWAQRSHKTHKSRSVVFACKVKFCKIQVRDSNLTLQARDIPGGAFVVYAVTCTAMQ